MGRLDQYAKEIFAQETPAVTHGGAVFQPPTELNLSEVRLDGSLLVRDAGRLGGLAAPWCFAGTENEIALEIKMQGEHLGMRATERGLLRRQARQVQRMENRRVPWDGDLPFWMAASHVPDVLRRRRTVTCLAPGCYRIETGAFQFLWVAANELPLRDELVPFLVARTGHALEEFVRWVITRRPFDWLVRMVEFLPMSISAHEELFRFLSTKSDDPEVQARQLLLFKSYVKVTPGAKELFEAELRKSVLDEVRKSVLDEGRKEGQRIEVRKILRRVLAGRQLPPSPEEEARIDACEDLATLERWVDQAVRASTVAEALRDTAPV